MIQFVYYALGERDGRPAVKIGLSRAPKSRLGQLRKHGARELLGWEPGDRALERTMHERYGHAALGSEWFAAVPDLVAYAEALDRDESGCAPCPHLDVFVRLDRETVEQINTLATSDHRSRSGMLALLVQEALAARAGKAAV